MNRVPVSQANMKSQLWVEQQQQVRNGGKVVLPKLPAGSSMPPAARNFTEDSKAELEEHIPGQPVRKVPYPKPGKSVGGY